MVDITERAGLDFVHNTGATGEFYFPEIAGSGCALFDYDGDGDLDVYAVQAHPLDPAAGSEANGKNRLFRNDLRPESGPHFVDVTDEAGVGDTGYGMGCAVGDYDNDGDADLLVTNFGPDTLYRNNGDGTFADVTATALPQSPSSRAAGADETSAHVVRSDHWSTSASFLDYDRDGYLDLFIAKYVAYSVRENYPCYSRSSRRDYCGPESFDPVVDQLLHNNGDGTFSDVTVRAGLDRAYGSGLGVVAADFNNDGWVDIYVANDGDANQLWINQRDGTFENTALLAGAAYNADGMPEAGMGVTAGDFDLDGDEDIFLAHLLGEHNTLLVNDGTGFFDDRTDHLRLGAMSRRFTGFGVDWFDIDGDGYLDLFVANGAVKIAVEYADRPCPYVYPNLLIRNGGPPDFGFQNVSELGGEAVSKLEVSRGAAFGDVDNDGDVDILISNSNGPLRLLRNDAGNGGSWLVLRLRGTQSNRDAFGAVVRVKGADGVELVRRVHTDGSYCSANDPRIYFGLAGATSARSAIVTWPSGMVETFGNLEPGRVIELREGAGRWLAMTGDDAH